MENSKSEIVSVTPLMLSLKPLDSITKINQLLAAIKKAGGVITKDDKIMIYLKIINHDAKKLWLEKAQAELIILPSTNKERSYNEVLTAASSKKQTPKHKDKKKDKAKKGHRIIDPNSSDYDNQLMKENLRSKFSEYDYGLSDW